MEKGCELWYTEPTNKMYSWCKLFMSNNEAELEESRKYIMGKVSGEKLDKEVKKLSQEDEMVYLYTKLSREELEKNTLIEEAKEQGAYKKQKEMIIGMYENNIDIDKISAISNISIEEIKNILGL